MNRRFLLLLMLIAVISLLTLLMRTSQINSAGNDAKSEIGQERGTATSRPRPRKQKPSTRVAETLESIPMLNVATNPNLEAWKTAIEELTQIETIGDDQSWVMDARNSQNYIPVYLGFEGNSLKFETALISIDAQHETGRIRELQLHTCDMNIEELRPFGIQLHNMLRLDPKKFIEWCDKVGNNSLDAPLYSSGNGYSQDPAKKVALKILKTFDDEKPWFLLYLSTDK